MSEWFAVTTRSTAVGRLLSVCVLLTLAITSFESGSAQGTLMLDKPLRARASARLSTAPPSYSATEQACDPAPGDHFLFLPYDTRTGGDWLTRMTAAFDHHYPNYTCSLGLSPECEHRGMEIALWEGEIARPIYDGNGMPLCYKPGDTPVLSSSACGGISGYRGVTGETAIFYDGHNGYDWAINGGFDAPIRAAASGRVIDVGLDPEDSSYGWTVTIDHLNG